MEHFYVVQDEFCHGAEFDTYDEAFSYLKEMRTKFPSEYAQAQILGPGLDEPSYHDTFSPFSW